MHRLRPSEGLAREIPKSGFTARIVGVTGDGGWFSQAPRGVGAADPVVPSVSRGFACDSSVLLVVSPVLRWLCFSCRPRRLRRAAGAAKKDAFLAFSYKIKATTHIKKLNQTITPPQGTFKGKIDLTTKKLSGSINLPPATFTSTLAGVVPLTATARIVQAKPVTGTINLNTFRVTATSTFNLVIVSLYAAGVPVNLVGNSCTTATPVSVTMSGIAASPARRSSRARSRSRTSRRAARDHRGSTS